MTNEEVKQKLTVLIRKLTKLDKKAIRHLEDYLRDAIPATKGKLTALMVEANDEQLKKFTDMLELSLDKGTLMNFAIRYTLKGAEPAPEEPSESKPEPTADISMAKAMADMMWPHLEQRITQLVQKLCPSGGGGEASAESVKDQLLELLNSAGGKA